jgi:transcriptional regulator with XRE-family HTH domain
MNTRKYSIKTDQEQAQAIAKRIINIRKSLGMTQKELAATLDMSGSYISMIESGKSNPGVGFFIQLSETLSVNLEYLFHGTGEVLKKEPKAKFNLKDLDAVDSIEKIVWLMENSAVFRYALYAYATQYVIENENTVKRSLETSGENLGNPIGFTPGK